VNRGKTQDPEFVFGPRVSDNNTVRRRETFMSHKDPHEFSDREKLLLSYYRAPESDVSRRTWIYDGSIAVASFVCLLLSVSREDMAFAFVAYALAVGRWFYLVIEGGRWNQDFRNIFMKYDAKLKDCMARQRPESSRSKNAEPDATPNGGPATPVGNSGVTEGPPSVS
jgi:hypothetical protein